jgi:hypothetical protein
MRIVLADVEKAALHGLASAEGARRRRRELCDRHARDKHVDALADAAFRHHGAVQRSTTPARRSATALRQPTRTRNRRASTQSGGWTAQSCRNQGTAKLLSEARWMDGLGSCLTARRFAECCACYGRGVTMCAFTRLISGAACGDADHGGQQYPRARIRPGIDL